MNGRSTKKVLDISFPSELPNLSYWIDVLDDDTVILTHFFYYGPTDEGFLTFEAGELMRFKD